MNSEALHRVSSINFIATDSGEDMIKLVKMIEAHKIEAWELIESASSLTPSVTISEHYFLKHI